MGNIPMTVLYVIYILIAVVVLGALCLRGPLIAMRAGKKVLGEPWIDANELVETWGKPGSYRDKDDLGCFIILVFNHPVTDGNYQDYENVLVGKAAKAYKGAYAQLCGRGSKELYKDFKNKNKHLYVQARFYSKDDVSNMEKLLIKAMKADKSYNAE